LVFVLPRVPPPRDRALLNRYEISQWLLLRTGWHKAPF
jgi:hypothetical protein